MNPHNDLDTPTGQREGKAMATLAAQFALVGIERIKSDPEICGQAPYYACRYGLWKPLESLEAAREYLAVMMVATRHVQELQAQ